MRRVAGGIRVALALLALGLASLPAHAQVGQGWIPFTWSLDGPGAFGTPGNLDCQAPELAFTSSSPVKVTVTDAGFYGDQFQVSVSSRAEGVVTSESPPGGLVAVTDPDVAFDDTRFSHAEFDLGDGSHTITIRSIGWGDLPWEFPYGFIKIEAVEDAPTLSALGAAVSELAAAGTLTQGQARSLLAKVAVAERKLAQGQPQAACNVLGAFINQVHDLYAEGVLPEQDATRLVRMAVAILADLSQ